MKFLIIPALLLSLGMQAEEYAPNDGSTPPGTFDEKVNDPGTVKTTTIEREEVAPASKNKTEVQSSGISTEDMNTSPNRAPSTDQEVIEGTTLSNEDLSDESVFGTEDEMIEAQEAEEEVEAQEEEIEGEFDNTIDYSTMPEDSDINYLSPDND